MNPVPLQILLIDDNAQDRVALRRALEQDPDQTYELEEYSTLEEGLGAIEELRADCLLLDHHLPDGSGVELMQELTRLHGPDCLAVVMMTGTGSESIAVEAMKSGTHDYLVKGKATASDIARAIKAAMFKVQTQKLLEAQRAELETLYRQVSEAGRRKDQLLLDLSAAKEAAERASAAKDEFLATLSHELRTPLMPILTAVSGLDPVTLGPEELRQLFGMIRRNVELEARLIEDLLDLTRIAHGKLSLALQPVDVHESIRHAAEICADAIAAKGLTLSLRLRAGVCQVSADPARLEQVFWNVISNAVKFTPPGGRLEVRSENDAGRTILLEVQDTGIGVRPERLDAVFRAFEQEQTTLRRDGLGLGLAIARALVEAQGGRIHASSPGLEMGTTIHISLPLSGTLAGAAATSSASAAEPTPPPVGKLAILLVEDHGDSAEYLSLALQLRGHRVTVARGVEEGWAAFRAGSFDALVSDIGLPDGTGLDLMRRIAAVRPLPAIALSGYGMERDVAASVEAGFSDHLTKPVALTALDQAMGRLGRAVATRRSPDGSGGKSSGDGQLELSQGGQ